MSLVHPNGSARPLVPWCGSSALPLQSVLNLSTAESMVKDTLESRPHHGSTFKKSCTLSMRFALCWWREGHRVDLDQMLVVVVIVVRITRQILVVVVIAVRITGQLLVVVVNAIRITV